MGLRDLRGAAAGHAWTIGSWLRHQARPQAAPTSEAWSTMVEDPRMGQVRLSGQLRHRSSSLLLVVHGLGSEIDAPYVVAAALAAEARGLSCLRLYLRGADRKGEDFYHAGLTADLHAALASPTLASYDRVFVLGYSLGGHVTLRYAVDGPSPKVQAIAAVSAPLDLDLAARAFDRPACAVYRRNVLAGLCEIYECVARRHPLPTPVGEARRIRKIRDWDDRIVAPRHGFRDADHYYRSVSVAPWLPDLRLRSLLLYAEDDPMVPSYVVRDAALGCSAKATVRWIEHGGHMGFPSKLDLGYGEALGLENQIMHWLLNSEVPMPNIVNPQIEQYLRGLYDDGDPVRREMEELAEKRGFPIVGPLVGRELSLLTKAIGAKRVFELGSGYGYSALFFGRAVGEGGVVHCTDLSPDNAKAAQGFLTRAGVWPIVTFHQEEATSAFRKVGGIWDIVYNDIDKDGYPETVDLAYEHLRPGGLFITDNVLWSGRVLEGGRDQSASTKGVIEFTRRLLAHKGFLTSINPTRDGVAVALRL